jgi:glycosyltransferase involved in cell wall biosynthesis
MKDRAVLIYNVIDCNALSSPKLYGAEFNLGLMVFAPKQKSPDLAFEILKRLKNIDKRYTLFIKGKQPWEYDWLWCQAEERKYYEKFYSDVNASEYADAVVFDPHGNNVPDWLSKIGFILSTSEHEGSHQAVAEGMASGAIPVIRNWPGADLLYPEQFVFQTVDEAVELILKWNKRENYPDQCEFVKQYARERFDQNIVIQQYDHCIATLLNTRGHLAPQKAIASAKPKGKSIVAMHVCYLNPENQSGYEIRVIEETNLLQTLGIRVIIACFVKRDHAYPKKAKTLWRLHRRLRQSTGAKIYIIPTNHYFDLNVPSEGVKTITRPLIALAKRHNMNLLHGQALYSTLHILRANKRLGTKVVFDVHGAAPEETQMSGGHPDRVQRLEEWEKQALKSADLRIFVSSRMKAFFQKKYGLPDLPHTIIPCCVHNERFRMSHNVRRTKRKDMGIDDKFVFLYLGTLSVWQWPESMFSLFAQFYQKRPDSLFYLLLPTSDHEKALSFLKKHNLPATSFIVDEIPHNEVGSVIGVADAGLLLRKSHPVNQVSSPTKFGEYLAAGVPVIATHNIGDTSGLIEKENLGLIISPTDDGMRPDHLERIKAFAEDVHTNRHAWARRCMETSSEKLAWIAHVNLLEKAYETITYETIKKGTDKVAPMTFNPQQWLKRSSDLLKRNKKESTLGFILHLGSWKAGSTLLQSVLRLNKEQLKNVGVNFIDHHSESYASRFLPSFRDYIRAKPEGKNAAAERASEDLLRLANGPYRCAVVSDQILLGHPFTGNPDCFYHADKTAMWLASFIKKYDYRIVFYIRRQWDFIEGMYQQELRKGRFLGDMEEFLQTYGRRSFSWKPVVTPLVENLGQERVDIVPFETIFEGAEQFIRHFFNRFAPDIELKTLSHSNPSFSAKGVALIRATYPLLNEKEMQLMEIFIRDNFSNQTHGRANSLGELRTEQLRLQYADDNSELFERFLPTYNPKEFGYC